MILTYLAIFVLCYTEQWNREANIFNRVECGAKGSPFIKSVLLEGMIIFTYNKTI